ncbi:MAG TPA: TrkA family potassium uptake protein [bacterium]|jgi:trk system potassium uptake protein TrkA|nr:TrkA family potassium uptake protein [bacterium]HOK29201.1 TrkA family potassium uptake protein [bacterium]HOL54525.1 TrkA family potassium uptake protein [bacterium]HOP56473.1 TrkA family potassium uptake protein [bacterium]HPC76891.1 TrkA family potassium uptake protein [bacterium]
MDTRFKNIAVIGLGRFGFSLAVNLQQLGCDVLAIDSDPNVVEDIKDSISRALVLDATDRIALEEAGIGDMDAVCISMGRDLQSSVLAALIVKKMGIGYILATAINDLHRKILEKIGVNLIISPEKDMGQRIAYRLTHPNILDRIEVSPDIEMIEIDPLDWMIGKTMSEIGLPRKFGIRVFAIKRGNITMTEISGDTRIEKGDKIYIYGKHNVLERFVEH